MCAATTFSRCCRVNAWALVRRSASDVISPIPGRKMRTPPLCSGPGAPRAAAAARRSGLKGLDVEEQVLDQLVVDGALIHPPQALARRLRVLLVQAFSVQRIHAACLL